MILVTGATGHLGGAVVRQIHQRGESVRAMVRDPARAGALERMGVDLAVGDILDPAAVGAAVASCSEVVHCAAGFVMWSRDVERDIIAPSVAGTRYVLEAASERGVRRIVYVSSSGTIRPSKSFEEELDETQLLEHARTPYLQGKIAAERWAVDFAGKTRLPLVVVNPGLILGPGFDKLSESVRVVADCVCRGQPFAMPGSWPITDVDDVAAGTLAALERGRVGERYLLAGEQLRFIELFGLVAELCGLPPPRGELPMWLLRPLAHVLGGAARLVGRRPLVDGDQVEEFGGLYQNMPSRKARAELAFAPRSARSTVARTVAWLVDRGFVPNDRLAKLTLHGDVEACRTKSTAAAA